MVAAESLEQIIDLAGLDENCWRKKKTQKHIIRRLWADCERSCWVSQRWWRLSTKQVTIFSRFKQLTRSVIMKQRWATLADRKNRKSSAKQLAPEFYFSGEKRLQKTSQWNFKELIKPKSSFFYVTLVFIRIPSSAVAQLGLAQSRLLIPSGEIRFPF